MTHKTNTAVKTIISAFVAACIMTACAAPGSLNKAQSAGPKGSLDFSAFGKPTVKRLKNPAPADILFVGNSYLYYGDSVHNHVRRMVAASGIREGSDLTYKSATIGGAAIFDHNIDHLLKPESLRVDGPFDVVLLQGGSVAALSEARRRKFSQTVAEYSRKIENTGAETVLYMTPAYVAPHRRFAPGMINDIASLYISAGNENNALVIPVGLAFDEAYRRRPDMQLHKPFDGSHPSLAGTYLAAATVYASLYDESPVGNTYDYYGAIDADTVLFLQTVARDTAEQFFER